VAEGVYVDDVSITCDVISNQSEVGSISPVPLDFHLSQNHPNPFNAATQLLLSIPVRNPRYMGEMPVQTRAVIYNVSGQKVKTLLKERLFAGEYRLIWDGTDERGQRVSSGIYLFRVEAGPFRHTKKMVLLR
jgi:hypothetical protein